jgi:uncharacterized protein
MTLINNYRVQLLVVALLLTGGAAAIAPMLPMTADVTEFVPADDPAVTEWVELTQRFGALDILMVGLEEPGEAFSIENLTRLETITNRLGEHRGDGLALVRSLTNLDTIRKRADGTIDADLLINSKPETPAERTALMERVRGDAQAPGSFISHDMRAYVIIIKLDPEKDSRELAQLVRKIVSAECGTLTPVYFGAPFIETMITDGIYRQIPLIAFLFVVFMMIPLVMMVRRIIPILLILGCAGISVLWWLGLLQLFGVKLTATASGAALVLVAVAAVLYARLVQLRMEKAAGISCFLWLSLAAGGALVTLLVFPIPFLAHFGQVAAIGMVAVALVGGLLLLPITSWLTPVPPKGAGPSSRKIRPAVAWAVAAVLLCVGVYAGSQGRFLLSPRDLFSADDEVGRAMAFFDRHMGGADVLQIGAKGDLRDPANCARLMRLTDLLQGDPLFADVRSVTQILGMLSQQFGDAHRIPPNMESLNNLWFFVEGNPDLRPLANDDRSEAMIAARIFPQTNLAMARWAEVAREAVERSAMRGRKGTQARLLALSSHLGLHLREPALVALLDDLMVAASPGHVASRKAAVIGELHSFMHSDEAPFEPTTKEWEELSDLLKKEADKGTLTKAIAAMESYQEWEYPPEVAGRLADNLFARTLEEGRIHQLDGPLAELGRIVGDSPEADVFLVRARGILIELLDPQAPGEDSLSISVSGFPAIIPLVDTRILHTVWAAALLLWGLMLLAVLLVYRNGFVTLRSGTEALLATVLTFGLGWLARINVDSASAVLYLLPPILGFFASPALCRTTTPNGPLPGNRLAPTVATALAAGALSLLATGVLPVFRIGTVMAMGMFTVAVIAALSRRIRA